ncbi:MAG: hypothetical protein WA547_01570 [Thermoplasmata archaeon]
MLLAIGVLAGALVPLEGALRGGSSPATSSGAPQTASTIYVPHLIVNVQVTNSGEVNYALNSVAGVLRPGDTIDLTHDGHNPVTSSVLSQINQVAAEFAHVAPVGVVISGHTFYMGQIGALANGSSAPISEIVSTLEPNGATRGLSYTFGAALSYFEEATALAHAQGLQSVGYPTSGFLPEGGEASYDWNYGQLASKVDQMWVEMQGFAYNNGQYGTSAFSQALSSLVDQVNGSGQPLSKVAIQLILGDTPGLLGVDATQALADIAIALAAGISTIDLWMESGYESYLGATIEGLGRSSPTPTVTFTETGLPAGTEWSVTLGSTLESSRTSSVVFTEANGSYGYSALTPTTVADGTRYVASPATGSADVKGSNVTVAISYSPQYALTAVASPVGAGNVSPASGWYTSGQKVSIRATPGSGDAFSNWSGQGLGSYTGTSNPAPLTVRGPINETAEFTGPPGTVVGVTFTETGLPSGTKWNVSLDGQWESSTNTTVEFQALPGSYGYALASPMSGANASSRYVTAPTDGTVVVGSEPVRESVAYLAEYKLSVSESPNGAGSVTPSSGWYEANSSVNLSAVPDAEYRFSIWVGTGAGNYTGPEKSASIAMGGPIGEVAEFSEPDSGSVLSLEISGLPPGTNWSANVGGASWTTNQTTITVPLSPGAVGYAVESPIRVSSAVEYVAEVSSGTVNLTGGPVGVTVTYVPDAFLEITAQGVGGVTESPSGSGWYPFGSSVEFTATVPAGSVFAGWNGTGAGSYSGMANPMSINVSGPITEVAHFQPAAAATSTATEGSGGGGWPTIPGPVLFGLGVVVAVLGMGVAARLTRRLRSHRAPH